MKEIVISIKPQYVELISKKYKNHEFRNYIPKQDVDRLWIYTSTPIKKIEYVLDIDKIVKYPETIPEDGIGNRDFNTHSNNYSYAYHIKHLHKLKDPIDLVTLQANFNFTAPQSYFYLENYSDLSNYLKNIKLIKIY